MSIDIRYETFVENEDHLQTPEHVGTKNNRFKTKIDGILKYIFLKFWLNFEPQKKMFPKWSAGFSVESLCFKNVF